MEPSLEQARPENAPQEQAQQAQSEQQKLKFCYKNYKGNNKT